MGGHSVNPPVVIDPRYYDAVIFDLYGVLKDAASIQRQSWASLFNDQLARRPAYRGENHSLFTDDDYDRLLRGKPGPDGVADFLASRGITLPRGAPSDTGENTICGLVNRQRRLYAELLDRDVPLLAAMVTLTRKLREAGVAAVAQAPSLDGQPLSGAGTVGDGLLDVFVERAAGGLDATPGLVVLPDATHVREAASAVGVRPHRAVVVGDNPVGLAAGREAGFALVVGVDGAGERSGAEADVMVADLSDIAVRTGDKRISEIPNALESYGQLAGIAIGRESVLFLNYDVVLPQTVSDPGAIAHMAKAAQALGNLAALSPVVVISGRDVADIRERVGIPEVWYAGNHGFELLEPDGSHHEHDGAAAAVPVLADAADELRDILADIPGLQLVHKRFAVAVHYPAAAAEHIDDIVATTQRIGKLRKLRVSTGHTLVELRPDIAWDEGTRLAWIRSHVDKPRSLIPIYIGGDLADEDAFDAVALGGVGIAVRHGSDGDRRTAARFVLNGPDEVGEVLELGSRWLAYTHQTSTEAWQFSFEGYDPASEKLREALCTVGNGYFATRGAAPESKAGQVHYPGTYAAGVYNRLYDNVSGVTIDNESLVNLPNWLPLTFRIEGGDWFDIDDVTVLSYRQTLETRGAVLRRELRFLDAAGRTTSVTQRRFVAMHTPHVAGLATTIRPEDWAGTVTIRSTLDGNVRNSLVERYRDLSDEHLELLGTREIADDSVLLEVQTNQSRIPIALAARTTLWRNGNHVGATYRPFERDAEVGHDIDIALSAGDTLTVEKMVTLFTGRDVATSQPADAAERWLGGLGRFDDVLDRHQTTWSHLWERSSIEFDQFSDELRVLRLHMLHLLQTCRPTAPTSTSGCRHAACTARPTAGTSSGTSCSSSRCSTCGSR